jgi:predicted nucleic acid-binding protein
VKAFFDTSVLVGAFYGDHPKHSACLRLLEDASKKTHFCAVHAVMTRLPVRPRITPEQGLLFVENIRDNLSDYAALTPLIWEHVNPYGRFDLDMNARLALL